ncbi:hypothetical protein PTI98_008301 [Pleurotus ostreatus]|nr:hypothetical protein PTI98_008301 [Pleurotus ostreatus]
MKILACPHTCVHDSNHMLKTARAVGQDSASKTCLLFIKEGGSRFRKHLPNNRVHPKCTAECPMHHLLCKKDNPCVKGNEPCPKPVKLPDETVAPTRQQWEENAYGFYLFITEGKLSNQKAHLDNFKAECPPDIYEQKVAARLNLNTSRSSSPQQPPAAGPSHLPTSPPRISLPPQDPLHLFTPRPSQLPRPSNAETPIHETRWLTPRNPRDFGLAREPSATPTPWHGHAQPSLVLEHETTAWAVRPASSLPKVQQVVPFPKAKDGHKIRGFRRKVLWLPNFRNPVSRFFEYEGDLLGFKRLEHVDEELAEILLKAWPDHFSVDKLRAKELGNALANVPYVVDEFSALAIEMWVRKDAWDITFMDMGQWMRLVLKGSKTPGWIQLQSFDLICGGMDFILDPLDPTYSPNAMPAKDLAPYLNGLRHLSQSVVFFPDPFQLWWLSDKRNILLSVAHCSVGLMDALGKFPAVLGFNDMEELRQMNVDLNSIVIKRTMGASSSHVWKVDDNNTARQVLKKVKDDMKKTKKMWQTANATIPRPHYFIQPLIQEMQQKGEVRCFFAGGELIYTVGTRAGGSQMVSMEPVSIIPLEKLRAGDADNQRTASMISNQEVFDMLDSNVPFWLGSHGFERLRSFATNILYKFITRQEEDWKKVGAGERNLWSDLRLFARLDIGVFRTENGQYSFWVSEIEPWMGACLFTNTANDKSDVLYSTVTAVLEEHVLL